MNLKLILEAALMASDEPLSLDRLGLLFGESERPEREALKEGLQELQQDYEERSIELVSVASGYRFQTRERFAVWVARLWEEKPARYSRTLLETLALIAYRQPITRAEIEDVRGVAVNSAVVKTLMERDWIRVVGYREVPGKPALYGTTKTFLDYFGLTSLTELPPLSEIQEVLEMKENLPEEIIANHQENVASENEVQEELAEAAAT